MKEEITCSSLSFPHTLPKNNHNKNKTIYENTSKCVNLFYVASVRIMEWL